MAVKKAIAHATWTHTKYIGKMMCRVKSRKRIEKKKTQKPSKEEIHKKLTRQIGRIYGMAIGHIPGTNTVTGY